MKIDKSLKPCYYWHQLFKPYLGRRNRAMDLLRINACLEALARNWDEEAAALIVRTFGDLPHHSLTIDYSFKDGDNGEIFTQTDSEQTRSIGRYQIIRHVHINYRCACIIFYLRPARGDDAPQDRYAIEYDLETTKSYAFIQIRLERETPGFFRSLYETMWHAIGMFTNTYYEFKSFIQNPEVINGKYRLL